MTTHELLELASLDALGLLDDDERDAFERAFQAAPPAIQAQVRREQARLARAEAILPEVEVPAGLRARVLAAVRDAIQAVQTRRTPRAVLPLLPSRGVSAMWRAAAIGCAAAALIFGFTTIQIRSEVDRIHDLISLNQYEADLIRDFGARFQPTLMDPRTTFVQFDRVAGSVADSAKSTALVLVDGDGAALVLARDLPKNPHGYALVAINPDGSFSEPIARIDPVEGAPFNKRVPSSEFARAIGRALAVVPQTSEGLDLDHALMRSKAKAS